MAIPHGFRLRFSFFGGGVTREVILKSGVTELVNAACLAQYATPMSVCKKCHQSPWQLTAKGQPYPTENKSPPRLGKHDYKSDYQTEHRSQGKPYNH
jgi:hypothetical protein